MYSIFGEEFSNIKNPEDLAGLITQKISAYKDDGSIIPIDPFFIARNFNIAVIPSELDGIEGYAFGNDEDADISMIAFQYDKYLPRLRFTLAHEIGHVLLHVRHGIQLSFVEQTGGVDNDVYEQEANAFASALLMPKINIDICLSRVEFREASTTQKAALIREMALDFGVSTQAMIYRLISLRYMGNREKKTVENFINPRQMKFSYDEFVLYKQLFNGILMKDFQLTPLIENDVIRQIILNDHRMENGNLSVERINELIMSARIEDFSEIDTTNTDELELAGEIYMYVNLLKSNVSLQSATDVHIFITKLNKWLFKYGKSGGTTREGPVRISGKTVKTSEPSKIMADLMGLANEFVSDNDEFILKITTYHHGFTVVHPFTDGNGRTARGFLNKQLQNHQLPMVVIKLDERDKYQDALEHADSGSLDALELFVMRHIVLSYVKIMSKLPDLTNFK